MRGRIVQVRQRGFTLIEMMVVVGLIIVMTAIALPAISKFLDGQSLQQSGRIVQSAFNEARRAAITQRARNYLVFFRQPDDSRPGEYVYGMRRFREKVGYEGEALFLLHGIVFDFDSSGASGGNKAGTIHGIPIPIFEGLPNEADSGVVFTATREVNDTGQGWIEFRRDGTINLRGGSGTPIATSQKAPYQFADGTGLFDINTVIEVNQTAFDGLRDQVDMNLRESSEAGGPDVDKRCFIDLDPNTGRVNVRVLEVVKAG